MVDRLDVIARDALIEALKRQETYPPNDRPRFAACILLALADQGFVVVPDNAYAGAVEALRTYGTHLPNCALRVEDDEDVTVECDCGYSAALRGQS